MDILKGIATLCTTLIFSDPFINLFSGSHPVTTKEQALEIGSKIMRRKYPFRNLDRFTILVDDHVDSWAVCCALINVNTGRRLKGGGGPLVRIRKSDGKIIESEISQR